MLNTKEKGITLIALILTIVILLIVAGVTISSIKEDGMLDYAQNAADKYELSKKIEKIDLALSQISLKAVMNGQNIPSGSYEIKKSGKGKFNIAGIEIKLDEDIELGYVNIESGNIADYELYYDDYYILKAENEYSKKDCDYTKLINVKTYGAIPNDNIDDTEAIRNAVEYLNSNGGTLYFPTGSYNVSATKNADVIISLNSSKNINIDFSGSTILLKEHGYPRCYMLGVCNSSDVEIRNGFLIGDRLKHDYIGSDNGKTNHQWGHGIWIETTENCSVYNMDISQTTGDGIVNIKAKENGNLTTTINQCNIHYCRRLGIQTGSKPTTESNNTICTNGIIIIG